MPHYVADAQVVGTVRRWDDGVAATHLVARLVSEGSNREEAQRAVQRCLDRGKVCLGPGLRIYLPPA